MDYNIILKSRKDAEKILDDASSVLNEYGTLTVADLYDLAELPSSYTMEKYAWNSINEFSIVKCNEGYMIKTPTPCHIDSLHDLTVKTLFGSGDIPEFNYKDISKNLFMAPISPKMSPERFKELLDELDGNSLNTLKEKNARYATDGDCLHNFRSGAEIAGGTPAQACWGYMTKHLTALRDMVMKNDFSNREDFLEKCQDTINYVRFLWCIGNDEENSKKKEPTYNNEGYKRQIEVYLRDGNELLFRYTQDTNPDVELFNDYFVIHYNAKGKRVYSTFTYNGFYAEITETFDGVLLNKQIVDRKGE